jgi:ECF sigma factor
MSEDAPNTLAEADSPGDQGANAKLFASLYADLRRLADRELRRFPSAGVSPTTLVHEAYLNLAGRDGVRFADDGKCLSYVARACSTSTSTIAVLEADRVMGRADGPIVDGAKPPAASRIRA